jgi:PhoH-like ATPase
MTPPRKRHERRIYVLDTNVLMHDPTSLFRFEEHDIFLPMTVLEELDAAKKGTSEVSRNVRQVSRFLDQLIGEAGNEELHDGLPLVQPDGLSLRDVDSTGRLRFQVTTQGRSGLNDNDILGSALALQQTLADTDVVLVSKDINLRIKATIAGLPAEDYQNDHALDDLSLLFAGWIELDPEFWQAQSKLESWTEDGSTYYRVKCPEDTIWYPNQCLLIPENNGFSALVRDIEGDSAVIEVARDYHGDHHSVWGINARNPEQNFALNLLMDPDIHFVSLLGSAGTGKTLLSLAAGLSQVLDKPLYREIVVTRATVPVGEDIGFLPGTEEEKMTPWMGALTDNLEVLSPSSASGGDWAREATNDLLAKRIKVRSMNFMRGRTFLNRYVIIDEAQNLTPKQMKTLITRAGPGTKMVCMGNVNQIDTPYLTETSSGLTYVVDRFKSWQHSGHVTLRRGERSPLADYASATL